MTPPPLHREFRPADAATLLNAAMGLLAITAFLGGDVPLGMFLVFAAIIVDGVDGFIARLGGGGGPLGPTLDTLADVVTFVLAPAVGVLLVVPVAWGLPLAATYMAAGLLRLARFQTLPDAPHFFGLSTPGGALVVGTGALLWPDAWSVLAATLLASILMVARRPMPKLRGRLGLSGVAIIIANLVVQWARPEWGRWALLAQAAFVVAYVVGGPAYLKQKGLLAGDNGEA